MKLVNKIKNSFNDKTNLVINSLFKPLADTMLQTAYDLTDKSLSFEYYSKQFYDLYKINYQKRKVK